MTVQTKSNPADEKNQVNYPNNENLTRKNRTPWVTLGTFIKEGLAEEGGKWSLNTQEGEQVDTSETHEGH